MKEWIKKVKNRIYNFFDKHFFWINPLLTLFITLEAALFTYSPSANWIKQHPIRCYILSYFIGNLTLLILLGLLVFFINIINFFRKKTITELNKKLNKYELTSKTITENIKSLFDGFLYKFATKKLNFTEQDRISLYIYDEKEEKFVLLEDMQ
jgi:hypothetical protein